MPVSLNCPEGHRLTVSRRYAGKTVRCPRCRQKVRIPPPEVIERKLREKQQSRASAAPPRRPPRPSAVAVEAPPERDTLTSEPDRPAAPGRRDLPPPKSRPLPTPAPPRKPPLAAAPETPLPPTISLAVSPPETAPPAEPPAPAVRIEPPVPVETPPQVIAEPAETEPPHDVTPSLDAAPAPSARLAVRGYEPEPERRWTSYSLGISLAVIGLFGAAPAVLEIADFLQSDQTIPVARWAWLAILAAFVQLAYAVYAAQLPDWSTAWVATFVGAGLAAVYAGLLGLTLLAGAESRVVALLELEDLLAQGRAARWCFVMVGVLGLYAYLGGRAALRWRHAFNLIRPVKEGAQ